MSFIFFYTLTGGIQLLLSYFFFEVVVLLFDQAGQGCLLSVPVCRETGIVYTLSYYCSGDDKIISKYTSLAILTAP